MDIEFNKNMKITEENSIDVKETPFDSEPNLAPTINQTINKSPIETKVLNSKDLSPLPLTKRKESN